MIPSERIIALLPRRSAWFRAARFGKRHEILLSGFERIHFGTGGALRVHRKPDRPNNDPDHAGRDVLRDLGVVLLGELFGLQVIGLDLGADHGAVALRVLRLHNGDRMRVTSGAVRQTKAAEKAKGSITALRTPVPKSPLLTGRLCSLNVLHDFVVQHKNALLPIAGI